MEETNPFATADRHGVQVRYEEFGRAPLGISIRMNNQSFILLSNTLVNTRLKYFICAHELYHSLEHSTLLNYYCSHDKAKNKLEYEANRYALKVITAMYIDMFDKETVSMYEVLDYFDVPKEVYNYV